MHLLRSKIIQIKYLIQVYTQKKRKPIDFRFLFFIS